MEKDTIRRWIKTIAAFILLITVGGIVFYILSTNDIIDETITKLEVLDFYISTIVGLVMFLGLWRLETWGWKSAVIFIPLSWVIYLFEFFADYEWGLGLFTAPFIIIDALIPNYLYKPQVCQFFQIFSSPLLRLQWIVKALFLLALFLAVMDIFSGLVAFITVVVVFCALVKTRKTTKHLKTSEDLTSG